MLNYAETASSSTIVPSSPVLHMLDKQETATPSDLDEYKSLHIGHCRVRVSPSLEDGYLTARKAYAEMEKQDECGACIFLTGYEYAHLTRQHVPVGLSPLDKREWQCGFIAGWNACTFGL